MKDYSDIYNNKKRKIYISNNIILLAVLILLLTVFSLLDKNFLTFYNISTMLRNLVAMGILALGLTPLMISKGIDVSFGSNLSLTTVMIALLYNSGMNIYIVMLLALLLTTSISFINGVLIEFFNLNALIATLGTMSMYLALALVISRGDTIGILSDELLSLAFGSFLGLPIMVWIFVAFIAIYYFVLNYTVAGRSVFVIGANPQAAYSIGIRVKKIRIILYAFFGLMIGFSAIFTTGLIGTGNSFHGVNLLLPTLSAILLGGIGLEGGFGNIWGTILGVLIISIIFNGLAIMGVSSAISKLLQGILLIIIVSIYEVRSERTKE